MKFFVASPWKNKDAVERLVGELTNRKIDVYSFLQNGANLMTGMSITEEMHTFGEALQNWQNDSRIKAIFNAELEGLKASDVVVLMQPAGHSSLLEAGIGYGMGKKVVTVGEIEKPEVFYLICDAFYPDIDAFLADLGRFN